MALELDDLDGLSDAEARLLDDWADSLQVLVDVLRKMRRHPRHYRRGDATILLRFLSSNAERLRVFWIMKKIDHATTAADDLFSLVLQTHGLNREKGC